MANALKNLVSYIKAKKVKYQNNKTLKLKRYCIKQNVFTTPKAYEMPELCLKQGFQN